MFNRALIWLYLQGLPEGFGEVEEPEEMAPAAPVHQPAQQPARGPVVAAPQPPASQPVPQPEQGEGEMQEEDIGEGGSLGGGMEEACLQPLVVGDQSCV